MMYAMLTENELRDRVRAEANKAHLAREARVNYLWLYRFIKCEAKRPRAKNLDALRTYYEARQ
jgi:hypothetical protein